MKRNVMHSQLYVYVCNTVLFSLVPVVRSNIRYSVGGVKCDCNQYTPLDQSRHDRGGPDIFACQKAH